jgi:vacuolar-type H+-ATPase subunit I/STV1
MVDCSTLGRIFTPTPPVNVEEHLRKMNASLDLLEARKGRLHSELLQLRSTREKMLRTGQPTQIIDQQILQHIQTVREIDATNKKIVAQYNEVARANNRREMLTTTVETTQVLSAVGRDIRAQMKKVGGTESVQDTIDSIGEAMEDADRLTAFASREIVPEGMDVFRETGVIPAKRSVDEELAALFGEVPMQRSTSVPVAASSSPYTDTVKVDEPLQIHETV